MDLRELILAARDVPEEIMAIPEWPDETGAPVQILVKGFDTAAYRHIMRTTLAAKSGDNATALLEHMTELVVDCVCNPATGDPLFTPDDMAALEKKNGAVVNRIVERILALSGMGPKAVETAKDFSEGTSEPVS